MSKVSKWRRHSAEFKRHAVDRMKTAANIEELSRELDIQRKLLYTWKDQLEGRPAPRHANLGITAEERKDKQLRDEITNLKSALADKTLENDFFRSALLKVKGGRQQSIAAGATASTTSSSRGRKSKAR